MKHRVHILFAYLIGALLLCSISSCQNDDMYSEVEEVSLVVDLGAPKVSVSTRAESDNDVVDGNCLYRVTLLIIDSNNKLVAKKDWNDIQSALPTNVSETFKGLLPSTTYKMIAVANYSAYGAWSGLSDFPNISTLTIGSNISTTLTALNNYVLPSAGTDYIVAKNPQPLTLVQEFTTPAGGKFEVKGELVRTYARLRIEIANRSEKYPLSVNSLKFGSNTSKFGYQTEPLMMVGDNQIPASVGNLSEASSDAITPFAALEVPALHDEAGNMKVAFDGYLYECKNTAGFEYSLNVGYPIASTTTKTVYQKGTGIAQPNQTGYYMIGYGDNNYYLTANGDALTGTQVANNITQLDETQYGQVIWYIEIANGKYSFKSILNDKYLALNASGPILNSNVLWWTPYSKRIYAYYSGNSYYYLAANNGNIKGVTTYNSATEFKFYPLTQKTEQGATSGSTDKNFNIPLQTIVDGVAEQTHIIRRNDFIDVLVTVSYNENTGKIDFHVEDWSKKEGNVEFN